jgi:histidinol-phosphatase (PHP family)
MPFNLHTHTRFSDGSADPVEYVEEAIRQGFTTLGFSDHSPVPFENTFAIRGNELCLYGETINHLKNLHSGTLDGNNGSPVISKIDILLGLEIDFIPGITRSFDEYRNLLSLDYTIGSVHLVRNSDPLHLWFIDGPDFSIYDKGLQEVFGGDIRKAVTAYYRQIQEMVTIQKPDIIGHLDKVKMYNRGRYFSEEDPWYMELVEETLDLIEENGCVVEVNTRGIYKKRSDTLFPGPAILEKLLRRKIPVTISSDAHKPHELSLCFTETKALLTEMGFMHIMNKTLTGWECVSLK